MPNVILKVRRMESDWQEQITAAIIIYRQGNQLQYEVRCKNPFIKANIEDIIDGPFYSVLPGPLTKQGYYANHATMFVPGTKPFFLMLPERLSWYGYIVDFVSKKEISKSLDSITDEYFDPFEDDFPVVVTKSVAGSDSYYYINEDGDTIIKYVPQGYIAISQDGKILTGGKRLNANITKPDAKWRIVPNQRFEALYRQTEGGKKEQLRARLQEALVNVLKQKEDYHPGLHLQAYEGEEPFQLTEKNPYWKRFLSVYEQATPLEKVAQEWIKTASTKTNENAVGSDVLPEHVIAYSPSRGITVPGNMFSQYMTAATDWLLFDGKGFRNLTKEQIALQRVELLRKGKKIHPGLLPGAFNGKVDVSEAMPIDTSQAVPHDVADVYKARITAMYKPKEKKGPNLPSNVQTQYEEEVAVSTRTVVTTPQEKEKIASVVQFDRDLKAQYFTTTPTGIITIKPELVEAQKENQLTGIQHIAAGPENFNGTLRPYQEYQVRKLTYPGNYRVFGGPAEADGMFINMEQGLGKTPTVLASDAILRNRGLLKGTHLVVCPRAIVHKWKKEISEFRGASVIVIEGTPEQREKQWGEVFRLVAEGTPPKFVVMGVGKIRQVEAEIDPLDTGDDNLITKELSADLQAIKHLTLGNYAVNGKVVKDGVIGVLTIDESALFANPASQRHQTLKKLVDLVTSDKSKGIIWTLNGDISSNGPLDTISELSWVNAYVRGNYQSLVDTFTEVGGKNRRVWKSAKSFLQRFGYLVSTMTAEAATGEDRLRQVDIEVGMGEDFAEIYKSALVKLHKVYALAKEDKESPVANYKLGLTMLLIQAAFNVSKPQRLIEYGLHTKKLLEDASKTLPDDEKEEFFSQIRRYMRATCENHPELGTMPIADMVTTAERDRIWNETVDPSFRQRLENVISTEWFNPLVEGIKTQIKAHLKHTAQPHRPYRLGLAGLSKMAVTTIYHALRQDFDPAVLRVQMIHGGLGPQEINTIVEEHNRMPGKDENGNPKYLPPVITMVTGAANYGMNLASDVAWRFVTWSAGKAKQFNKRFHRNPYEHCIVGRIVPSGIPRYMKDLEDSKIELSERLQEASLSNVEELDEEAVRKIFEPILEKSFLQHLAAYPPEVVKPDFYKSKPKP